MDFCTNYFWKTLFCTFISMLFLFPLFSKNILYYLICLRKVVQIPENISFKFKTNILQSNLINITYRVSQKKFDLRLLVQNCTFFCATLLNGVFFNIFWKFVIFWSNDPKKNPQTVFFSQNQKFRKIIIIEI